MAQSEFKLPPHLIKDFVASKQTQLFQSLKQSQFSGELWLKHNQQQWVFYIYLGRVLYATGGPHLLRRLRRHLLVFCPDIVFSFMEQAHFMKAQPVKICWEYDLLCSYWEQGLINREQLTKVVKTQIVEILFDLTQTRQVSWQLKKQKFKPDRTILIDGSQLIVETWKLWQDWQAAKIADRSPNSAPVITQPEQLRFRTSPKTYQALTKLLNKPRTLRELALEIKQDLIYLTRLLIPYIQQGLIELVDLPDLTVSNPPEKIESQKALIITIFNTSVFSQYLDPLLKESGYYYLNLEEEILSISQLISLKPDLLFIEWQVLKKAGTQAITDLQQLQQTAKIPVIIFVKQTGFLEEMQAKAAKCGQVVPISMSKLTLLNLIKQNLMYSIL